MLNNKIISYLKYIIDEGVNLQPGQVVEICSSSYISDITYQLRDMLISLGASEVIVTFNDGNLLKEEISKDWRSFLEKRIALYNSLILKCFVRINLLSPFLFPMEITEGIENYIKNKDKLKFVFDYINSNFNQHTVACIPNEAWARKLKITVSELWDRVISFVYAENEIEGYRKYLEDLNIKELHFYNSIGTDVRFGLINDYKLFGAVMEAKNGFSFRPNIPCFEVCTSPNKYLVNGTIAGSNPIYYKGLYLKDYSLEFKDGRVINSYGLDKILSLDENMKYCGEVAIVIPKYDYFFKNTLLDENMGCHLALGCGFNSNSNELINNSLYHIDLIFGTNDINCVAYTHDNNKIVIIENGKFKLKEE